MAQENKERQASMTKKISIARALKEKNRIAGRLALLRDRINKENSVEKRIPRSVDVRAVFEEARATERRLIAIKAAISVANAPIVAKIIELEETKSEIVWLRQLDAKEGIFEQCGDYRRYGAAHAVNEYNAIIPQSEVNDMADALQKHAEKLQDELDEFNASTRIEVDIGD